MKLKRTILATAVISMSMTSIVFAGTWKNGTGKNQNKWWYENENGSYPSAGWQWIDGNGDGTAECYYFDKDGWMLANTTTPDGYTVNGNGAWIQNGTIQTKKVNMVVIGEKDFIVSGNNSVTQNNADNSIISNWKRLGYMSGQHHIFVTGDSLTTARGITFGASKNDVIAKYGSVSSQAFNAETDQWYRAIAETGTTDAKTIVKSATVLDYFTAPYGICFYFNNQDQLIGVVYYLGNSNDAISVQGYAGEYSYSGGASYLRNEQTGQYELLAKTADASEDEWFNKIFPSDAIKYGDISIKTVTQGKFIINFEYQDEYQLLKNGTDWVVDENKDGILQDSEKTMYSGVELLSDGRVSISMKYDYDYRGEQDPPYNWPDHGSIIITAYYTKK